MTGQQSGGGGMTGATGDLTPDSSDEAFVPAELREVADPDEQGRMTREQAVHAPAQHGDVGEPGEGPDGPPSNMMNRDDGYGSTHGLRPDDPAYRMESHGLQRHRRAPRDGITVGGDELADDDEHY